MGLAAQVALRTLLGSLGPLGMVFQTLAEAQMRGRQVERQVEVATRFLQAMGYDVRKAAGTMRSAMRTLETSQSRKDKDIAKALRGLAKEHAKQEKQEKRRASRVNRARAKLRTARPGTKPHRDAIATLEQEGIIPEIWPEEQVIPTRARGAPQPGEGILEKEIETPGSSNVFSIAFQRESRYNGVMFVTFKAWAPGMKGAKRAHIRGPMYGYYGVPTARWAKFKREIGSSGKGAGKAVWDHLRTRGSRYEHQFSYRLQQGALFANVPGSPMPDDIPVPPGGVYIPRKATAKGFKTRHLPMQGPGGRMRGRSGVMRSTLPEVEFRARPNTGAASRET